MLLICPKVTCNNISKYYSSEKLSKTNFQFYTSPNSKFYYIKDEIFWRLCHNVSPWAAELLGTNNIIWESVSTNSSEWAAKLLKANPDKIVYQYLSKNSSDFAGELLMEHPEKIDWVTLSANPSNWAYVLLQKHPKKIAWVTLSANPSDWACKLLISNPEKIIWRALLENTSYWASEIFNANSSKMLDKHGFFRCAIFENESEWVRNLLTIYPEKINTDILMSLSLNYSFWALDLYLQYRQILGPGESLLYFDTEEMEKYL